MRWTGSVALISGASRGIGNELARQAVARGARVGLLARSTDELEELARELGDACVVAAADVTSSEELATAVKTVENALGPVDIVVNNAGIGHYATFLDTDIDDLERMIRTNYVGAARVLKAVLPGMVERRRGHLVSVGSISGRIGSPFEAAYSASKFALTGLTEALSVELAPFNIKVSLVNPGPVDTPFFETRGVPYDRTRPKPVPASKVARTIIKAVERERLETYVDPFLRQAVVSKTLVPPLFAWGTARAFATELRKQVEKHT
jgi:short-subunit dehydrogenase